MGRRGVSGRVIEVADLHTSIVWDGMDMAHFRSVERLHGDRPTPASERVMGIVTRNGNVIVPMAR